ncbi:DUF4097 family beta strand repeat-containing protein [Streptomyces sp. NPDC005648]|uniref:DUF4097 family beta strand repeat-containing protein n=1 Tax=Streptomyces sp. NPDC005648 TaxID=3157044 RepID=UPI0033AEE637
MQVFDTPEPILATIELNVGHVRITAGDRTDTTVDVLPADHAEFRDLVTAAEAVVTCDGAELLVSVPSAGDLPRSGGAVSVAIELPAGSAVYGKARAADFHGTGRLGECRIAVDCGHIRLDRTGSLHLDSLLGNVTVGRVSGDVEAVAESGDLRIGTVEGRTRLTRTQGVTHLGECVGDAHVSVRSGDVSIGRAHAAVGIRAEQADISVHEALRGPLALQAETGTLEIGIADGVEARLDLLAGSGTVYRSLDLLGGTASPADADKAIEVRARTGTGDIVVRRAVLDADGEPPF